MMADEPPVPDLDLTGEGAAPSPYLAPTTLVVDFVPVTAPGKVYARPRAGSQAGDLSPVGAIANRQGAAAQPFAIRVISLANSPRRAAFGERARTSLEWDFLDARTSNTTGLPYDDRKSTLIYGRALKPSELGCFSSHYALWKFCAQTRQPVIILEDDVDPDWPFLEAFARDYQTYAGIDFLRFWSLFEAKRATVGDILGRKVVELLGCPRGGQGYLLTPAHAKRLLKRLRLLARPVDDEIDRVWRYGAPNLIVDPPPLSVRDEPSDIGDEGRNRFTQTGALRLSLRLFEKLRKEVYIASRLVRLRALL